MKFIVVVLLVAAASMGFEITEDLKDIAIECAKENKVDLSVFKPDEKPDKAIFENHDYKCFGKCMSIKAGIISEEGVLNNDKIKEVFKADDAALAQVTKCAEENKQEDMCERIYKINECVEKNMKME